MVGGLGTRLRPLTDRVPKPMLHVGGKPILQTIVENFASYGFADIVMCVGYRSDIVKNFFKDGSAFGVNITYVHERKRMGTAGALSLLKDIKEEASPFFVMNGDILTNINLNHLLEFHESGSSIVTMCVRKYDIKVPFGVVDINDNSVVNIKEKPVHNFFVNAGIYLLDYSCLSMVPSDEFYDMPTLIKQIVSKEYSVSSFPLREYWIDIGRMKEYERANSEYHENF